MSEIEITKGNNHMKVSRLIAIGVIVVCTAAAWFILGGALRNRTAQTNARLAAEVAGNWGAQMAQPHPSFYYISPTSARAKRDLQPVRTRIDIGLEYEPKKKGLLWYRTYRAVFAGEYIIQNPTPITQTIYVEFGFPAQGTRYDKFSLVIGEKSTDKAPANGKITESVILEPGAEVPLRVAYEAGGMDWWSYSFGENPRVRDFSLVMTTSFGDINIPAGAESPTSPERGDAARTPDGWQFRWEYSDLIGANSIGTDMPAVVNPGPVAARMTFFAPVSLLFFFAVLVILGTVRGVNLHPVNYFFLAAGCFAFQLLFAYLVDLAPAMAAFAVAAAVSLVLVTGYLWRVAGAEFAKLSAAAQSAYMVLFSYSFFFRGLTGITITVGAIATLALLMGFTAKVDWEKIFERKAAGRFPGAGPAGARPAATPPPLA